MIEHSPRRFLTSPGFIICLVLCLVGTIGWCFRDELKRIVLTSRVENSIQEAESLARDGDWSSSERAALAAHQLDPANYPALAALFRATQRTRSEILIPTCLALSAHPSATREARLDCLRALLLEHQPEAFAVLFRQLPEEILQTDDAALLLIDFLLASAEPARVLPVIQAQEKRNAAVARDPRFLAKRISALLYPVPSKPASSLNRDLTEAYQWLRELEHLPAGRDSREFRTALLQTASLPLPQLRPQLLPPGTEDWLENRPSATVSDKLAAERLRIARELQTSAPDISAAGVESRIASAVERYRASAPEELATWLFSIDRPAAVLDVIDPARGMESLPLYLWRLRALERSPNAGPAAALKWLETPHPSVDRVDLLIAFASCLGQLDRRQEAMRYWNEVAIASGIAPDRYPATKLYPIALSHGLIEVASRIVTTAAASVANALPSSSSLLPVFSYLQESGDLPALRSLFAALLQREKGNPELRNNHAYLSFVLGVEVSAALESAQALVKENPGVLPFHTTLAMGWIVSGDSIRASEALAHPDLNWSSASPADRAIRAKVASMCGQEPEESIDPASLSRLEQQILLVH